MDFQTSFSIGGLLQQLGEAVLLVDTDGYIVYANKAASQISGYGPDELNGESLSLISSNPDDRVQLEYDLRQTEKTGRIHRSGWHNRKDGSRFWGDWTLTQYEDALSAFRGYSCILRDTSAQKQQEMQLRESEERHRLMVEGVRDYAIFMLDQEGYISSWNEGAQQIKGYSRGEIIGRHFSTFYTTADLQSGKPARELKIAIATGKYEEEGWRVRKDGSLFWASVVITALFNTRNEFIGFSKVTRDLSERREAEERMRASEERYRFLVEQVSDYGIFMMDEKGRIISWNEGAHRINGYTADEIIGKYFSIFYPEEDILNGKPEQELQVARATGKYEEEGWRLRKDGSPFWANVVITSVYNEAGVHIGFSKVTRDLTERREAESAMRDSNIRYRRLTEELRQTNTDLAYVNGELEQFTSIVSHDLQEPIRTIKSFLQLIELRLKAGQQQDLELFIGKSIAAANRMRELITNLLQYSQLGRSELVGEDVNVPEIMSLTLQNLRSALDISGANITVELEAESVFGDAIQLQQLLQNLIGNAIKFTGSSSPEVAVRNFREGSQVRFEISDNGIGIREEDMQKVFEIFRRLDPQERYPGTGIGLAICKKIVERHRGQIWLESVPGTGTTFFFTLNELRFPNEGV